MNQKNSPTPSQGEGNTTPKQEPKNWKCRWFGHRWEPVYCGAYGKWKIIAVTCFRCGWGHDDLINFLAITPHDYGTRDKKYYV